MGIFGNHKLNAFGLDVSDSSIKVCQLLWDGGRIMPAAFADTAISEKIINNHIILNEQRLADSIRKAIADSKIDSHYVVCSIMEAKSFVRTLKIPKMPEKEIDGAIPYELEADIPIPIDQVYLDWQLIAETPDGLELLVMASPKDYVDSLINSLKLARLTPLALELAATATARAMIGLEEKNSNALIVDIGGQQTNFIIVQKGIIVYTSSIPIAGHAFTQNIAKTLGVSVQQAEKLKLSSGLTSENKDSNLRPGILPILDNIVDEIKNVLRFFEEHVGQGKQIDSIFVCGGSARIPGVVDYISARMNLGSTQKTTKVRSGNPWVNVSGYEPTSSTLLKPNEGLSYTASIGLALRGVGYESR